MSQFHNTMYAQKLFQGHIPSIVRDLKGISKGIQKANELKEKELTLKEKELELKEKELEQMRFVLTKHYDYPFNE